LIAHYVDASGAVIDTDEWQPNRERPTPPLLLPTVPRRFRCLRCEHPFMCHPGGHVECPECGHRYVEGL
jgi:hypothetical protein